MTGLSDQIVYVLIVAAVLLARFLWQQRTRVRPWEEALRRAPGPEPETGSEPPPVIRPVPDDAWGTRAPEWARAPRPPPGDRPRFVPVAAPAPPAARRFSRQSLFGDRRRTQNAVVASIILGPCRSMAPYTTDAIAQPAPGSRPPDPRGAAAPRARA